MNIAIFLGTYPLTAACFWCRGDHPSPRQRIVQRSENGAKCKIIGHIAHACKGGARTGRRWQQQSNFVDDDSDEEAFVVNCRSQTVPIGGKKFFAHLHLMGDSRKLLTLKIDSASTCNTRASSVLIQLFPNVRISETYEKQNQHLWKPSNKTKRSSSPCVKRKEKLHTIDFLLVNVSGDKSPLLSEKNSIQVHLCFFHGL